jgi:hypothetical protein
MQNSFKLQMFHLCVSLFTFRYNARKCSLQCPHASSSVHTLLNVCVTTGDEGGSKHVVWSSRSFIVIYIYIYSAGCVQRIKQTWITRRTENHFKIKHRNFCEFVRTLPPPQSKVPFLEKATGHSGAGRIFNNHCCFIIIYLNFIPRNIFRKKIYIYFIYTGCFRRNSKYFRRY